MRTITLDNENRFEHEWLKSIHKNIPAKAIQVTESVFLQLSQNNNTKQYDTVTKVVSDYIKPFDLLVAQNQTIRRLKSDRNSAIIQPITSKALGTPHDYETTPDRVSLINLLLGIGLGGQIECTSPNGSTSQRQHTHQQLVTLASAIAANMIAVYTDFETLKNSVTIAKNEADIIAVTN